jgi:hypothetical protein
MGFIYGEDRGQRTLFPVTLEGLICTAANQEWALDSVHDAVESGRTIRVLTVVDAYTRECLALEVDTSFASRRVTRVLDSVIAGPRPACGDSL